MARVFVLRTGQAVNRVHVHPSVPGRPSQAPSTRTVESRDAASWRLQPLDPPPTLLGDDVTCEATDGA